MTTPTNDALAVAHTVREACVAAAKQAYTQAAISGLCGEGALEAAIGAIETLDIETLLAGRPGLRSPITRQP